MSRCPNAAPIFMASGAGTLTLLWMLVCAFYLGMGSTYATVIRASETDSREIEVPSAPALAEDGLGPQALLRTDTGRKAGRRRDRTSRWDPAVEPRRERSATGLYRLGEPKFLTSHGYTLIINNHTGRVEATNASDPPDGVVITKGWLRNSDTAALLSHSNLSMTIMGRESNRYICMNATGFLYSSPQATPPCHFKEDFMQAYSTFCSVYQPNASNPQLRSRWLGREWCIGIKRGKVLPGYRSRKSDNTSWFTKRSIPNGDVMNWPPVLPGTHPGFPTTSPSPEPVTVRAPLPLCPRNPRGRRRRPRKCRPRPSRRPPTEPVDERKTCGGLFEVICKNRRRSQRPRRRRKNSRRRNRQGLFSARRLN